VIREFDHVAQKYDKDFTSTHIGKKQRDLVYSYLEKIISKKSMNILEVNCGTGQDAIWLAEKGHLVDATDISSEMIVYATKKAKAKKIDSIHHSVLDLKEISSFKNTKKYDLIFSNFGGTNCVDLKELESFLKNASNLLVKGGKIILVIMPKFCLWESFYFSLKGKFSSVFRRQTNNFVEANVEGVKVKTWYHSPNDVKKISKDFYCNFKLMPVGFFLPPSYLEPFFKKRPQFLEKLNQLELKVKNKELFSKWSDHYLIELEKK